MKDDRHLVSFLNVSASVGDTDISAIVEMRLSAAANSIPQLTLLVDAAGASGSASGYIGSVSLGNASSLLSTLKGKVKTSSGILTLSITCVDHTLRDTQTLILTEWMLTDVGISPVQIGGTSSVELTFMHPLCKANFGGAMPGLLGAPPALDEITGSNPLEVFISALKKYADAYRDEEVPSTSVGTSPEAVRKALIVQLDKAVTALDSSLSWTEGGLPAEDAVPEWDDLIALGISTFAMPGRGCSVFQMFSGLVVPECSLAIGGDYTQHSLDVGPFKPWGKVETSISDSDIVSLQFPQSDPSPLSGVRIAMAATESEGFTTYQPIACQLPDTGKPTEAFYVPKSELSAEFMYGPIHMFQEPGWLSQAASYEKSRSSPAMCDNNLASSDDYQTASSTGRDAEVTYAGGGGGGGATASAVDYSDAMLMCAKAYFETSFMKDFIFSFQTRLMFSSDGDKLYPGKVVAVKSGGNEVIAGYVVSVEHIISVASRTAHSRIVCTHPRFGGVLPEQVADSNGGNALY